jgi:hypothetical protein
MDFIPSREVGYPGGLETETHVDSPITPIKLLPGQALSSGGRPRLDYASVAQLAFPFMLNSAVQAVLNATDTWRSRFRSHLTVRLRWHGGLGLTTRDGCNSPSKIHEVREKRSCADRR